jgi:DNA-binding SARP family transcriptional activator
VTPVARIRLLGKPAILDEAGESQPVRGHQAWALLARVLLARRPLERRVLAAELFGESVDPLGSLRWCLAALRKALDASDCLVGDPVEARLPPGTSVDLWLLEEDALPAEDMQPLLGGIEPRCSAGFATWLLVERERLAAVASGRIRQATLRALALSEYEAAIRLAELAVGRDAYDESAHIFLAKALALAGRPEAALAHVEATERLFLDELGEAPSAALRSAARLSVAAPPGGISAEAHVKSLIRSGMAALAAGAPDAGIETLRQAAAQAETCADPHLQAEAAMELGKGLIHSVRGFDDEGAVLLRQCVETARTRGHADIAAAGYRELGYVEALAGRRPSADSHLRTALEFATGPDDLAGIHSVIGFNLVDWGEVGRGLDHYELSLEEARRAGNRRAETWSLGLGAWGLLAAGRADEAAAWARSSLRLADDIQWVTFRPWPVAVLGESRLRREEPAASVRTGLEEGFALSCQLRDPCWEAANARSLALTYAADRRFDVAAKWLQEADRRCVRVTDPYVALRVEILATRVQVSRELGRDDEAAALMRAWIGLAARAHMDAHVDRAASLLARR